VEQTYRTTMASVLQLLDHFGIDYSHMIDKDSFFEFISCYFPDEKIKQISN